MYVAALRARTYHLFFLSYILSAWEMSQAGCSFALRVAGAAADIVHHVVLAPKSCFGKFFVYTVF